MSAKISGKVWELDLEPTEKLVLLALADHADHEGNNVRPGNDLLVAKTGLSQQTISAKIAKFVELGILEPTKDGRGRGVVREFSIEPERAERKQYFIEREERKLQAARTYKKPESYKQGVPSETKRYNLTEQKVQPDSEKVQFDAIAYKEENRQEPSERERAESASKPKLALVSSVGENPHLADQPFSPNDDFSQPAPRQEWTVGERFILKACGLWDDLTNQEKPIVETNWKTKQAVQTAGKYVAARLDVASKIGGTPKMFLEFWHDELKRLVTPRPDYVVEQWEAYDRWLIANHETHRRIAA